MSTTYSQIGPGYDDASLFYNGATSGPVTGSVIMAMDADELVSVDSDEDETVTVSI